MIARISAQHERGVGIVEFAGDRQHFIVAEDVGAEHHAGGIAREPLVGEGIDLENMDAATHRRASVVVAG